MGTVPFTFSAGNSNKNKFLLSAGAIIGFLLFSLGGYWLGLNQSNKASFPKVEIKNALPTPGPQTPTTASFTGKFSDIARDEDGNGRFEYLEVDVEVNVTEAGSFGFTILLTTASGEAIAAGGLTTDFLRAAPVAHAELEPGLHNVPIYFEGRVIRSFGAKGPYTVNIGLFAQDGTPLDTTVCTTQAYSYRRFQ